MKKRLLSIALFLISVYSFSQNPTMYLTSGGSGYTVIEGNTYNFSVNLFSVSSTPVVVDVLTITGTATTSDFTPLSTTVTIPAGQLSSPVLSIATTNDSTIEQDENFRIVGTVTSGNTSNTESGLFVTIFDNDSTPSLIVNSFSNVVEGLNRSLTISTSNYFSGDVSFTLTTSTGTAGSADFTAINTTRTILAGQRTATISFFTLDDTEVETDETFTLTATVTSGNTTNTIAVTTITILDNDTMPNFSLSGYNVNEGSPNANAYLFLSRAYNSNITFQITTANGTGGNADYTSINETRTILSGNRSMAIEIPITDDSIDEPEETFTVNAMAISGNTTNSSETVTITIIDNDGLPDFQITANDSIEEGRSARYFLRLTHPSDVDTDIQITTSNGTAGALDYTSTSENVTIPAGSTQYYASDLLVPTTLDQLEEPVETFNINGTVTSGNTYNSTHSKQIFIVDNYELNAQDDTLESVAEVGTTFNLLANDTYHGLPVVPATINASLVGTNTIGATLSSAGVLTIPANAPIGYFPLSYTICETATPTNCDTATITVIVISPLKVDYNVTYSDFNGDTFVSAGDLITYDFVVENIGNATITNIQPDLTYSPVTVTGGPIASLGVGQIDTTTFTAIHILTQDDINFGYYTDNGNLGELFFKGIYYGYEVSDYAEPLNDFDLPRSDGLKLNAFVDTNSNGTQESGEINFPLGQFNYEINGDGVIHNLYTSPFYLYESNPTTTYNLTYDVDSDYAANNTTSASYSNVTVPIGSGANTYNFPITVSSYQDVSVSIYSASTAPVPGFFYYNYISYTNNSNVAVPSGTITFNMDNALSLIEVYPTGTAVPIATGFTYNFTGLQPYQTKYISIKMQVPTLPTVALGQLVTNSVVITPTAGDILPLNNTSSLTQTIVGSYDPNDKTESHGEEIVFGDFSTDEYLTYTIRFENTGTANAINVKVEDVLDAHLDVSTLKMVAASHRYTLERVDRNLVWNFFAIDLPPSEDDSEVGHGYITFKIKPNSDFALGDVIPNTASIYFDFNPAIVTNTWTSEFVQTLGIDELELNAIAFYPNPVKNDLHLQSKTPIGIVEITSVLGKRILTKVINELEATIDVSELSAGLYVVKINSEGQVRTVKIIKE